MTRDDIIRMAQEAGWHDELLSVSFTEPLLERFAALVAAAECEKWTVVAEQAMEALAPFASDESDDGMMAIAAHEALRAAIRARGDQ